MSNFGKIEKCILDIVWYIPIKKLRKSITNYLRTLIEYNEIIRKQNEIILKYTINKLPEKKIYELEESNFIKKYNEINSSYNKKCIFYIGSGAGFFSEFNLMVISILYCLCNKIEFKLYSQTANFSPKGLGWEEFFLPFCTQVYDPIHMLYNGRLYKTYVEIEKDFYKKYVNADFFTYDILDIAKTILKTNEDIHISDLEINGHIKELFGIIAKNIFRFNDKTKQEIKKLKSSLNLPEKYYGFHIRSGDKITEAKLINETKYMDIISNYSDNNITDIFVSTDNYSIFENLVKKYGKKYNFYTLTSKIERGYDQNSFDNFYALTKYNSFIEFFASIDILLNSEICLGSYTSNPSVFLGAVMTNGKFIEVNNINFIDSILF